MSSTTTSQSPTPAATGEPRAAASPARAFLAVLWRDLYVTGRELPVFLAQVVLQPLFLLFVFGKVLTDLGFAQAGYTRVLFPGILALTAVVTGLQSTAFPLVIDFSFTKEIEDRLLAPLPVGMVAVEKVVFASLRALLAALVMLPVGVWILGSIPWRAGALPLFVTVLVLGCLVGSCLGMIMGTAVPPNRINVMFALILTPLLFTGASQYPWVSLDHLPWFQVVTALNPLTYVSEGMRAAMVPDVPHIRPWISVLVLTVTIVVSLAVGIRLFLRRAID
jgi:ABC-2 type transport system permease protein